MGEEDIRGAGRALRLGTVDQLPPELVRVARMISGMPRYIGTHPGGIVITPGPYHGLCHTQVSPAGLPVLAWEKDGTERAGLVKIGLLGNRSLAVLRDCLTLANGELELVNRGGDAGAPSPGAAVHESQLAWDFSGAPPGAPPGAGADSDPPTRALVESGRTMGVFYIELPATRQLLHQMGRSIPAPRRRELDHQAGRQQVDANTCAASGAGAGAVSRVRRGDAQGDLRHHGLPRGRLPRRHGGGGLRRGPADGLRKVLTKKRKGGALEDYMDRFLAGCAAAGINGLDWGISGT